MKPMNRALGQTACAGGTGNWLATLPLVPGGGARGLNR
jgi:hypothetical protein